MPRKVRIQYGGAVYHVMCRGDRREAIFADDADREMFVATLAQMCERTGMRVHSYVLMGNHFHPVIETPRGNLVAGMKWLGTCTQIACLLKDKMDRLTSFPPLRCAPRPPTLSHYSPPPPRRSE